MAARGSQSTKMPPIAAKYSPTVPSNYPPPHPRNQLSPPPQIATKKKPAKRFVDPAEARLLAKQKVQARLEYLRHTKRADQLPFTEIEYRKIMQSFERLHLDGRRITWEDIAELSAVIGLKVEEGAYKKLEREHGPLDFQRVLQCLYPTAPPKEVKHALAVWGQPGEQRKAKEQKDSDAHPQHWHERYKETDLEELSTIYQLYSSTEAGLSWDDLRKAIPASSLPSETLDELFTSFGKTRTDTLTLEEFATIMEDIYLTEDNKHVEVKLYFQ